MLSRCNLKEPLAERSAPTFTITSFALRIHHMRHQGGLQPAQGNERVDLTFVMLPETSGRHRFQHVEASFAILFHTLSFSDSERTPCRHPLHPVESADHQSFTSEKHCLISIVHYPHLQSYLHLFCPRFIVIGYRDWCWDVWHQVFSRLLHQSF